jgi:phage terminase large subunit-like protein
LSLSDGNQPELAVTGHDRPRLETIVKDAAGSFGADVQGWAEEHLGITLMPWQVHVLNGQLAYDNQGELLHRTSICSTARQNGKTTCLGSLVGFWLTEMPKIRGKKQTVLTTANRLDLAITLFDELAPVLVDRFGATSVKAYGRNSVTMPDGSKWTVRAAKPSVGHGTSNDLIVADEIFDISDLAISGGLIPSMRARKSPLLSCWSTAGTEASTAFLRWREQGLRAIDKGEQTSLYFAEWSPPPDIDPMTPAAWAYGNPALGHTLEMSTIESESENPNRAQFLRASVNLWVASDRGWIPPGVWPSLKHEGDIPKGGIVAIETSMDDSRYFGLRAVSLPDRRIVVTVAFVVDSFAALLVEVDRLKGRNKSSACKSGSCRGQQFC